MIARVQKTSVALFLTREFEIHFRRDLVIKKVLPRDDGKVFICMTEEQLSTTILKIAKGDVYISVIQ